MRKIPGSPADRWCRSSSRTNQLWQLQYSVVAANRVTDIELPFHILEVWVPTFVGHECPECCDDCIHPRVASVPFLKGRFSSLIVHKQDEVLGQLVSNVDHCHHRCQYLHHVDKGSPGDKSAKKAVRKHSVCVRCLVLHSHYKFPAVVRGLPLLWAPQLGGSMSLHVAVANLEEGI